MPRQRLRSLTGECLSSAFLLCLLLLCGVAAATYKNHRPCTRGNLMPSVALGEKRIYTPNSSTDSFGTVTWVLQLRGGCADKQRQSSCRADSERKCILQSTTISSRIYPHLALLEERMLQQSQGEQKAGRDGSQFVEVSAGFLVLQEPLENLKSGDLKQPEGEKHSGSLSSRDPRQVTSRDLHSRHPSKQRSHEDGYSESQANDSFAGLKAGRARSHSGVSDGREALHSRSESSHTSIAEPPVGRPATSCSNVPKESHASTTLANSEKVAEQRHLSALQASSRRSMSVHLGRRFRCGEEAFRIQQELRLLQQQLQEQGPREGLIGVYVHPRNIREWVLLLRGPANTPYANELYRLVVKIPKGYPMKPPICFFSTPAPKHPHIYSNGDICLNLLQSDWHPSLSVEKIARAILSMMASAKQKQSPLDDALHAGTPAGRRDTQFLFHDDSI